MFQQLFWSFFSSFSSGLWVSCGGTRTPGRTDGRTEGNVRTRGNPVSVHEKSTRWLYHFFLAMVLRSRGPSARAGAPLI